MKIFRGNHKNPFPHWSEAYAIRSSELASMPSKESMKREFDSFRKNTTLGTKKQNVITAILQQISKLFKK